MQAPQIIVIALQLITLLLLAHLHGQPRDEYNFWHGLVSSAITFALLIWGGFFS